MDCRQCILLCEMSKMLHTGILRDEFHRDYSPAQSVFGRNLYMKKIEDLKCGPCGSTDLMILEKSLQTAGDPQLKCRQCYLVGALSAQCQVCESEIQYRLVENGLEGKCLNCEISEWTRLPHITRGSDTEVNKFRDEVEI